MLTARATERTEQEWFRDAERTYTEKHQGCPWCGGSHRVFCQKRGTTVLFHCQGCDFQTSRDDADGRFAFIPGEEAESWPILDTMCEQQTPPTLE